MSAPIEISYVQIWDRGSMDFKRGQIFRTADVNKMIDGIRQKELRGPFEFLAGTTRASPRIHCKEGACLILHSMDRHRFIARTVRGYSQDPIWDVAHNFKMEIACYRLLIIDDSDDCTEPKSSVLFYWNAPVAITEYSTQDRNIGEIEYDGRMRLEIENTKPINVRFEYFGNRFKRFALVVGPPHMRTSHIPDSKQLSHITDLIHGSTMLQPTCCVIDSMEHKIEVLKLSIADGCIVWPVKVEFDPRQSRDHMAAMLVSSRKCVYLPRSEHSGTLALADLMNRRIVGILGGVTCTGLQYACAGRLIITSSKDRQILSSDGTVGCVLVVSGDDLSILYRLSPPSEWTVQLDSDVLYSAESRWLALMYNRPMSRTYDKQIDGSDHTVAVAVYNIAGYDVRPLTHMCLETIFNSARCAPYHVTIDSLPVSNYVKQICKSIVESSQK